MKRNFLFFSIVFSGLFIFGTLGYAELVGGRVVQIDPATNTLVISQTDFEADVPKNVSVQIMSETTLMGIVSFSSIKIGDEIWAEAEENEAMNHWVASSIQRITGLPSD